MTGQPADVDALGEALVLVGDALGRVDHQQGDVGAVDRLERPDERVVLGALVDLRLAAHPGRVDEADRAVRRVHDRVDRVAGGAGHVVDHRPVLTDEPVEQRGLARRSDGRRRRRSTPARPRPPPPARRRPPRRAGGSTSSSSRSPVPRPWSALTGHGSPRPSSMNSQTRPSRATSSTLLATSSTGAGSRCSTAATRASSSVTPVTVSTTIITTSADRIACSLCADTLTSSSSPPTSHPPVSTSRNSRPCHSPTTSLRSRVTPGRSSTIASRRPRIRFIRVDLPTLGRPTMATTGRPGLVFMRPTARAARRAWPSVATTSTGRGSSAGVVPSRKRPPDRQTSGSR